MSSRCFVSCDIHGEETYVARTDFAVGMPTRAVGVNRAVDAARTRAIALFQLRNALLGVLQLTPHATRESNHPLYIIRCLACVYIFELVGNSTFFLHARGNKK